MATQMDAMTGSYDPALVVLSILIAVVSSYALLGFVAHIKARLNKKENIWISGGAVALGGGIWSMHFVGMLAYSMPMTVKYHLDITIYSLILPIVISFLALKLLAKTERVNHYIFAASGLMMGIGIALMHYMGMAAMHMPAEIMYDPFIFSVSIIIAITAATAALYIGFNLRESGPSAQLGLKFLASFIMGSAMVGMHYTGMAAASFIPADHDQDLVPDIDPTSLAVAVAVIVTLIQGFSLIALMLDSQLATKEKALESETMFRVVVDNILDGIIIIGKRGIIESFNTGAEKIFSYSAREVIGKNINILIPEPHHHKHDGYIENYLKTGEKKIIGIDREVSGLRKGGTTFPMELSVTEMDIGKKHSFIGTVRDITERKKHEEELQRITDKAIQLQWELEIEVDNERETSRRIEVIMNSSLDALIQMNSLGNIINWSSQATTLFGWEADEVRDQPMTIIVPPQYREAHTNGFKRFLATGQSKILNQLIDIEGWHRDGYAFPIELTISPLEIGEEYEFVAFIRDISERKKNEMEMKLAKEQAEQAGQAKSDFLANMSHEIRTPMNAIIGMSHLALQTELNRKQRNYIEKVQSSSEALLGIINDILDFSKIEAGKLNVESINFHLEDIFDNLANLIGLKSEKQKLELVFDLPTNLPTALIGDPLRLGQVLTNLGNNAVKFTEQGEVVISVKVVEQDDQYVTLHFAVRDTGIGMNPEQQKEVFNSFSQGDASTTRQFGGTGLGLSISKQLIEMMKGEIWVESSEGVGSTFYFTIRFEKQQGERSKQYLIPTELDNLRVLLVDDNSTAREILSSMLLGFGLRVDHVCSGQSALSLLEQANDKDPYKLVMMDWKMPDMDGIETAHKIEAGSGLTETPTMIMITAHGRDEVIQAALGININTFLTKPICPAHLLNAVKRAMGYEEQGEGVSSSHDEDLFANTSKLQGAKLLLVEDNEINQELALDLLVSNGITVEVANDGREALELLDREPFDGVLMDCQMPVMDGYTATRKIREQARFKDLPVLAMTANAMIGDREKVLEAGMNDHISKPVNVNSFFQIMAKWITPSKMVEEKAVGVISERLINQAANNDVELPEFPGIDQAAGLAACQGKYKLYHKLLIKFRDSEADFAERFRKAQSEGNQEAITRCAHTLRGVAGSIGAIGIQRTAESLEMACKEQVAEGEINRLLEDVATALSPVMSGLSVIEQSGDKTEVQVEKLDPEKLKPLLSQLRILLEDDDTYAAEVLEELESLPGIEIHQSVLKQLSKAIRNYEFEQALNKLSAISSDN